MSTDDDPSRLDAAWSRSPLACHARSVINAGVLGFVMDRWCDVRIEGRERLKSLDGPAVFVANHASHMDTPLALRSLPGPIRRRTAVAAAADYFYLDKRLSMTVALCFGTVPLERKGGGDASRSIELINDLVAKQWSLLIYAEGTRSRDGSVAKLRPGAAVLAMAHGLPIVPMAMRGTHGAMPVGKSFVVGKPLPPRHPITVTFGEPIRPQPDSHRKQLMEQVRVFFDEHGLQTTLPTSTVARAS